MKEELKKEPKKHPILKIMIIILISILIFILCYSFIWIHKYSKVEEYAIINEKLNSNWNGLKIIHFSDIHFGKTTNEPELKKIIKKINNTNPDIVIFTGDLLDESINLNEASKDNLKNLFQTINARIMKLAIIGDNDYKDLDFYKEVLENANFKILENENILVFDGGTSAIQIGGFSSLQKEEYNLEKTFQTEEKNINYKILIAHEPEILDKVDHIDLILSGHSLGGLIYIPNFGGLIKLPHTSHYTKGKYQKNETTMYVSSGIGTEKYSFRFLNPPSINLYRFYNYN